MNYPELSKFEKLVYQYLSMQSNLLAIADIKETNPLVSGDLGNKGRVVISQVYSTQPRLSRAQISPRYQFVCWDFSYAKARRLQETISSLIESWDKPAIDDLRVLTPVCERMGIVDFSPSSQLYFSSVLYRFPINRVV